MNVMILWPGEKLTEGSEAKRFILYEARMCTFNLNATPPREDFLFLYANFAQ